MSKKVRFSALIILDGFGYTKTLYGNAIRGKIITEKGLFEQAENIEDKSGKYNRPLSEAEKKEALERQKIAQEQQKMYEEDKNNTTLTDEERKERSEKRLIAYADKFGIPYIRSLKGRYEWGLLDASGLDVGLPAGQMGNSEVGHLNIGAGRVIYQDITRISKSIQDGDFFKNEVLLKAMENAKQPGKKLHLMGLLGEGGVHSHIEHLYALLEFAKQQDVPEVLVHCFLDGRDLPPTSAATIIKNLEKKLKEIGKGRIASVVGRYYAMDRDNNWDRLKRAYDLLTYGGGIACDNTVVEKKAPVNNYANYAYGVHEEEKSPIEREILKNYARGVYDEFMLPIAITEPVPENPAFKRPICIVGQGDSVIFYNFRSDRAKELTRAFTDKNFSTEDGFFDRVTGYLNPFFVCFTNYDNSLKNVEIAFKQQTYKNTLGEYLSANGLTQLRIAETEKYAHVTNFFNGGVKEPNEGEDRVLIPSPKVKTYDLQPEMSAPEVADRAVELILSKKYDAVILNFANCDMVGHTGKIKAAVQAVGVVDECVKKVVTAVLKVGGTAIVTADHGNVDKMMELDGSPFTAHTTNPVPVIVVDNHKVREIRKTGKLCDLAPTMLQLMGLPVPDEMTGKSLLK
ncbi:MAG: 2,3-bisphosphoglycerate-independent phosphoglycerate mutase [Clostridiaceae bacterium]|jgi:2,3-bisphosphoglycerate-independent phosphoglycerate mutase|nr:2,3-bisphosphoglycerate-independent phosphoglycerate mutase [Clostridiaceae bacterium]